ncbi:alpha/beta-hydrolase [Cadophora sp. DSE1049]|nr:alpha/beta-hydrolase [Cadophora sp. DSE1049]
MISPSGKRLHFNGYKVVNSAGYLNFLELWRQTTTLYVTMTDHGGEVVGRGILHILPADFGQEVQTFETSGLTVWARARSMGSFLAYWAKQLAIPFFSPLGGLQWPSARMDNTSRITTPSQTIPLEASDKVKITMLMWNPIEKDGKESSASAPIILFIPGAAVDHQIFALPAIEKNAINYFREAGYRTYCVTHRVGRTIVAQEPYTPFDARRDIHAALAHIRKLASTRAEKEPPKIYLIAHCAGSVALSCGLLDGTIPADWIAGITCSNVFMNPKFGKVNHLLSITAAVLTGLYGKLVGSYWDCASSLNDSFIQRLMNQALRLYPAGDARESCNSFVGSLLTIGILWHVSLWTHKNLNEATHAQLERFVGGTSMRAHEWLMSTGRLGCVTTNAPTSINLVTPENIDRLKGIPILFFSGSENWVFTPENTDISYTTLCNAHGRQWYEREVFQGRGHLDCWMGSTAYQDVYPRVRRHVDKVMKGI